MKNKDFKIESTLIKRKIGLSSIYAALNKQYDKTYSGEDDSNFKPAVRKSFDQA